MPARLALVGASKVELLFLFILLFFIFSQEEMLLPRMVGKFAHGKQIPPKSQEARVVEPCVFKVQSCWHLSELKSSRGRGITRPLEWNLHGARERLGSVPLLLSRRPHE